jgi:putative transposase
MSIRKTPFIVGEYYHIYNRGNDKKTIFFDNHDFARFMLLLYLCNNTDTLDMRNILNKGLAFVDIFSLERSDTLVDIGVYTLMPNHFHILLYEKTENGISIFMQKLATAYSMYFNQKNSPRLQAGVAHATM